MLAAWHSKFGPAVEVIQLGDLSRPVPKKGEVLVRVFASGINPLDVKKRAGNRGNLEVDIAIPHYDGAGMIEEVGPGVDKERIGQRVWVFEGQFGRWLGTAAEYITILSSRAVSMPDSVTYEEGACIGIPALTAHKAVFSDGSVSGKTVLVTGAAGSVGSYESQFASLDGATVIGTVSSELKGEQALADGAHHTINYKQEDVISRIRELTDGQGVDRIVEVELGGNFQISSRILKTNGVISAYASMAVPEVQIPFYSLLRSGPSIHIVACFNVPEGEKIKGTLDITKWMVSGKLNHRVGEVFPLEKIVEAHEAVEKNSLVGSAVLSLN